MTKILRAAHIFLVPAIRSFLQARRWCALTTESGSDFFTLLGLSRSRPRVGDKTEGLLAPNVSLVEII
jgi:hypothetical protein